MSNPLRPSQEIGSGIRRGAFPIVAAGVLVLVMGMLAGCSQRSGSQQASATHTGGDGLTIRYGGRTHTFTEFAMVRCTTNESGDEVLEAFAGDKHPSRHGQLSSPVLSFEARPDLVGDHASAYRLPVIGDNTDDNPFTLFAAVPTRRGDNEASSQEEGAAGTVSITDLACGDHPTFTLTADARLGSELSEPTIPVRGSIGYP